MSELRIRQTEAIEDWVKRMLDYFQDSEEPIAKYFLNLSQQIGELDNQGNCMKLRMAWFDMHADICDMIPGSSGVTEEQLDKYENIFFPEGFNSNESCQMCLKKKSECICKDVLD